MRETRELSDFSLEELEKSFDPYYMFSDDFSVWSKHNEISKEIQKRKRDQKLESFEAEVEAQDQKLKELSKEYDNSQNKA